MKRTERRRVRRRKGGVSLRLLLLTFTLAVLINAGLMTSASYMLILRTGVLKPLRQGVLWPMILVLLCIIFAALLTTGFSGRHVGAIHKVNKAMKKDHFPPSFIDQMLDRLAGKANYCFLDGYSGYNQIAIASEDQEKTTFTCPYGTYAF